MANTGPVRFAAITDAAIDLLAEQGMRGLTHRAVDARAGLPLGSTSAYFRTRRALIEAVVRRLADLDREDQERSQLPADEQDGFGAAPLGPAGLDLLAERIAALLDHWLTAGRTRTLARYACLLEATHHPELREILAYGRASRALARTMLAQAGAADPERRGDHFVAFVDGLLFDRLVGAGALTAPAPGSEQSRTDLHLAVRTVLYALTGRAAPDTAVVPGPAEPG
ncbi:TetR/AcrR family transcriptional regulator [Plantactinospora sonchi]|uniref:TetR family transcriptional regulator n=1 Tax=Plantactinospora sonchi TaxID=1544735 RepID=A0ABU7S288_9ACTN